MNTHPNVPDWYYAPGKRKREEYIATLSDVEKCKKTHDRIWGKKRRIVFALNEHHIHHIKAWRKWRKSIFYEFDAHVKAWVDATNTLVSADAEFVATDFRGPPFAIIARVVCQHYGVQWIKVKSPRRAASLVHPRQVIMYLAREMTSLSFVQIGQFIGGRDHTTAMHGASKLSAMLRKDERLSSEMLLLSARIRYEAQTNAGTP